MPLPVTRKKFNDSSHYAKVPGVLVVLDSNAFHGDVNANRGLVRSILDAAHADEEFELFVPEVVMQELDKHYAAETKRAVRDINQAIGEHRDELRRLGLEAPPRITRGNDKVGGYRPALEERLNASGGKILPVPNDLTPAVPWAVARRKPFKESGKGFPDAVIWLSILELAVDRKPERIVFVCRDGDFAVSKKRADELAPELAEDLVSRGCAGDQVRLVPGIGSFADEIGINFEPALIRAKELAGGGAFEPLLIERLAFSRVAQDELGLSFGLDEDPWVESVDVESIEIEGASELPGKRLRIEATAELGLLLNLDVYRADFPFAEDDVPLFVTEVDFDQYYIDADLAAGVSIKLEILADMDATEVDLELGDLSLTEREETRRALHGWRLEKLYHIVSPEIEGAEINGFVPEEAIESTVDEAILQHVVDEDSARLLELVESDGTSLLCHIEVDVEAHLSWTSNSPTTFDADHFASLAVDEGSGAPILQGFEKCLLTVDLTASWNLETQTWHDLEINAIELPSAELKAREGITAAERFELEQLTKAAEEQLAEEEEEEEEEK